MKKYMCCINVSIASLRAGLSSSLLLGVIVLMSVIISAPKAAALPPRPVHVILMLDLTGSISDNKNNSDKINDLQEQKDAAKAFLNFFATKFPAPNISARPKVGIGTFNNALDNPAEAARILTEDLTHDYDTLLPILDGIVDSRGWTNIAAALSTGAANLLAEDPLSDAKKFLVFLSDGVTNRPGLSSYSSCNVCGCPNARSAAELFAEKVRGAGVQVLGIHYVGRGESLNLACPGEPDAGRDFMKTKVSYLPSFFYDGNGRGDLKRVFDRVACSISCDDNDPCTIDTCDVTNGTCQYEVDDRDLDQDGRLDCGGTDTCFGDDALIGTVCEVSAGSCSYTGEFTCGDFGAIVCGTSAAALSSCEQCSASFEAQALDPVAGLAEQFSTLCNRVGKALRSSSGRPTPQTRRIGRSLPREGLDAFKSIMQQSEDLKAKNFSCNTQALCVTMSSSLERQVAQQKLSRVSKKLGFGISILRRKVGTTRLWRGLNRESRLLRLQASALLSSQSLPYKVCE